MKDADGVRVPWWVMLVLMKGCPEGKACVMRGLLIFWIGLPPLSAFVTSLGIRRLGQNWMSRVPIDEL